MILKFLMLGIWMVLVPLGIGYFALGISKTEALISGMERENNPDLGASQSGRRGVSMDMGYALCLGYILMWAIFQLVAVPYVIRVGRFWHAAFVFEMISLSLAIAGMLLFFLHLKYGLWGCIVSRAREALRTGKSGERVLTVFLWAIFLAGLLFQMLQAYRLAYADGDDAFYIPVSVEASQGGGLYMADPYTGEQTNLNLRYGLAPFPIWVAFIASKCQVNAAVAAHSLMPLVLIPITYLLYLEIGKLLCRGAAVGGGSGRQIKREWMLPLFMIFVTLLQIFGNYSIYPASTFLLTRTRQGKAALGNVILPFFVLLLYKIAEQVKTQGKAGRQNVLWLMAAMTAGCLCSTMAGFLCSMLVMITVCLLFILYRKPAVLWQGFLGCVPGIFYALLYLKL